jgi:hypothetical protein
MNRAPAHVVLASGCLSEIYRVNSSLVICAFLPEQRDAADRIQLKVIDERI